MNRRRNNNSRYEKPAWEIEKERAEKERQEEIERGLQPTEENFPALGTASAKPKTWGGRKFTELASEWRKETEDKKAANESGVSTEKSADVFVMPMFRPSRVYVEEEDNYQTEKVTPEPVVVNSDETEWITVDHTAKKQARLIRKQARMEERLRRMDNGEDVEPEVEEENKEDQEEQDDSCWAAPQGKDYTV